MLTNLTVGAGRGPERGPARPVEPTVHGAASPAAAPANRAAMTPDDTATALRRAADVAIARLFADRAVSVTSYYDESTGRMVYRVADAHSGEVLLQQPAEVLLRLYASARGDRGSLVAIEA